MSSRPSGIHPSRSRLVQSANSQPSRRAVGTQERSPRGVGFIPWPLSNDAASKLIWLGLRNITADWGRAPMDWKAARSQFAFGHGPMSVTWKSAHKACRNASSSRLTAKGCSC